MYKKQKGALGEEKTVAYLENKGYKILARNFRSKRGEIDIIATTNQDIIFVEVKNWDSYGIEGLEYSINQNKKQRILETSNLFLWKNPQYNKKNLRFDVVLFNNKLTDIHYIENAF